MGKHGAGSVVDDGAASRRGYAAALVSTSLGSDSSFRLASPPSSRGKPRPRYEAPDSSLEELIDSFRASASSFTLFTGRNEAERRSRPTGGTFPTSKRESATKEGSDSDGDGVGVSPMPKLTNAPRPKPSLSIGGPRKTKAASEMRSVSRVQGGLNTRSKLASPMELTRLTSSAQLKVPNKATSRQRSPQSSSGESTKSSALDEIEAPDSDDAGDVSVDDLISRDLIKFNRLVSSSFEQRDQRSLRLSSTNEAIDRELRKTTRFRGSNSDERGESADFAQPNSPSPFKLEPVQSIMHRRYDIATSASNLDLEDSFAMELRVMKDNLAKEQEKKKAEEAAAKEQRDVEERKKKEEGPAANIGSLREAVDTIDKSLLIALRPFELMRQEMDKEEAKVAVADEKAAAKLEIPAATQSIVDQLEQTFGNLTRQREAELKAKEDAAAEAKAAEEAKKKSEEEMKAAADADLRKHDEEILKLIPLRGRLFTSEQDIHEALLRLELAETIGQGHFHQGSGFCTDISSIDRSMSNLRDHALRRAREIEESMHMPVEPRAVDWHRSTFHLEQQNTGDLEADEAAENDDLGVPYPDIVKTEIVDKLDLTILKLKHALSIDKKEAEEKESHRKRVEEETAVEEKRRAEDKRRQEEMEANAASARQRVMGLSSIEDLAWVGEVDLQLRAATQETSAIDRLDDAIDSTLKAHYEPTDRSSSPVTDAFSRERIQRVKTIFETPQLVPLVYKDSMFERGSNPQLEIARYKGPWFSNEKEIPLRPPSGYQANVPYDGFWSRNRWSPTKNTASIRGRFLPDNQSDEWIPTLRPRNQDRSDDMNCKTSRDYSKSVETRLHGRGRNDRMHNVKQVIHDLQQNRREKANWIYSRHR